MESDGSVSGRIETIEDGGVGCQADAVATIKVGRRVFGYYAEDEGYFDNRLSGQEDANEADSFGGRVVFLMQPSDRLSVRLSAFLARTSTASIPRSIRARTQRISYSASRVFPAACFRTLPR